MRKFPIFLLVDVSESMAGDGLVQLENGMRAIVSDLMQDPHALENVWMSVIAFAGRPRTLVPLTELAEFVPPHLPIGAGTDLAAALVHLMDEIDRGVQSGTSERKGDWRPLVFLLTDGVPTTDTAAALARWRKNYAGRVSLVAVSIGGGADDT
ncbi:MAG: VWA domain-containing protein, partial [Pseudomonadota bacterium]